MPDTNQGQSQTLNNSIQISVDSSGDVELEREIFRKVSSVGRQLGSVSAVLEHVLATLPNTPGFAPGPGEFEAVAKFRKIQAEIAAEKAERDFERLLRDPDRLVHALERLARDEPENYSKLQPRLVNLPPVLR